MKAFFNAEWYKILTNNIQIEQGRGRNWSCTWISKLNKEEDAIEVLPAFLIDDARLVHNRLTQVISFLEDQMEKKLLNKNNQFRGICRTQVIDMDIVNGSKDEEEDEKIDSTTKQSNAEKTTIHLLSPKNPKIPIANIAPRTIQQ